MRVETLRRWERDGKLTTVRTSGGQRLVPAAEVARLIAERQSRAAAGRCQSAQCVPGRDHEGHPRQGLGARGDPSRSASGGFPHHARSGRRARPRTWHGGNRNREGDQRDGGGRWMRKLLVLATSSALLLAACSESGGGGSQTSSPEAVELTVSGAASLTEAFGEIGGGFEAANSRHHGDLQLRPFGWARGSDQRRCPGRCLRLGEPDLDGFGAGRRSRRPGRSTSRGTSSRSSCRPTTPQGSRTSTISPRTASSSSWPPKGSRSATTLGRSSRTRGSPKRLSRTSSRTRRT